MSAPPAWLQSFSFHLISLFIQGLPFLFLAAILGSLAVTRLPISQSFRKIPRNPFLASLTGAAMGLLIPACECFAIPLVRRLRTQGLPTSTAITFVITAPTLNPLCLISTWTAFSGTNPVEAILARILGTITIAIPIAIILSWIPSHSLWNDDILREFNPRIPQKKYSWGETLSICLDDLKISTTYYLLGCITASIIQNTSFLPSLSVGVAGGDIFFMMIFAFFSGICSMADSFVANCISSVSFPAKMAFLWLGPILSLKLLFSYPLLFKVRPLIIFSTGVVILVFLMAFLWSIGGGFL